MADFFEKITGSIDKGIKTVTSKSKELIETTKLKGEIRNVEASIQNRFQALGKKVYEMINREGLNGEELKADCVEVASLFKKITELEEAIKKVELEALKMRHGADIVLCNKCKAPNKSDAKFCMNCGSAIMEEKQEGKSCPSCGVLAKEGAKFCMKCGGKIE
jgi:RNA polymerase subunit RPABC4/transcription elongation factor Spt4